jgi:hypothetical protein
MKLLPVHERAQKFCDAFNHDNLEELRSLLALDCVYQKGEDQLVGPDAIIDKYRANMAYAHQLYDRVEFQTTVTEIGDQQATVKFTDILTHQGRVYDYNTFQQLTYTQDFIIARIDEIAIPGEREGLIRFKEALGLLR